MNNHKKNITLLSILFVFSLSAMDIIQVQETPNIVALYNELLVLNKKIGQTKNWPKTQYAFFITRNIPSDFLDTAGKKGLDNTYKEMVSSLPLGLCMMSDLTMAGNLSLIASMQNFYGGGQAFHYQQNEGVANPFQIKPVIGYYIRADLKSIPITIYGFLNGLFNAFSKADQNSSYYEKNYQKCINGLNNAIQQSKVHIHVDAIYKNLETIEDGAGVEVIDQLNEVNEMLKSIIQKHDLD